ncbi:MAG: transposase [Candidatus Rickettsia vulgarisii]
MYDGFVKSAEEVFGSRLVVIDRYHVSRLYREPLGRVRIEEMQRLKSVLSKEDYTKLESMMWIIRKKHECLSAKEKEALEFMYIHSPLFKKVHKIALKLTHIFNSNHNRKSAITEINRWIKNVQNSNLMCFNGFINTLSKYSQLF